MDPIKKFINILEKLNKADGNSFDYYAEYIIDHKELDLSINVDSCGNILFPLSNDTIKKMLGITKPAKFGLKDKTLYDSNIRDTNEISADKIHINCNTSKFTFILDEIRNELGLPKDISLKAKLHNILIYSKGQFFTTHQDTEKLDGMLATLVMVLPSPHIGGALTIKHNGKETKLHSENIDSHDVKFIAFYSDCHHEVQKITDGHRVVVTYNLIAESSNTFTSEEICSIKEHQGELTYAISTALNEQSSGSDITVPRITYLLNHQYTKHGLSWDLLRGSDRLRVELIKMAAQAADCEVILALIEAHETWSTNGGYRYGDSNEGEEPQELVDSEIGVMHAINIGSKPVKYNQHISIEELCYHLPNNAFEAFATQYEGYMGNYGNTVDYWYHRAAIIIWRTSDSFVLSFLNDPNAVIKDLIDNFTSDVPSQLKQLWPHWSKQKSQLIDLRLLLELSILVNEPNIAEQILSYCSNSIISKGVNDWVCKLFAHYGSEWAIKTMDNWLKNPDNRRFREPYVKFANIVQDFVDNKADRIIVNKLIEYQINCINSSNSIVNINKTRSLTETAKSRVGLIQELIKALQIIDDTNTATQVLDYVIEQHKLYPVLELVGFLGEIKVPQLYSLLKNYILRSLHNEIMIGLRSADDWYIDARSDCKCEHCIIFDEFMRSKTDTHKIWPINQNIRLHIIDMIKNLEVPISYEIEAKGSPHKLLLTKSDLIHTNAKTRFEAVCLVYKKLSDYDKI